MTSREARRQRREAERKTLKKTRKAEAANASNNNETAPRPFAAPEAASRAETNRKNSFRSTGPRTPEGKLASSRTNLPTPPKKSWSTNSLSNTGVYAACVAMKRKLWAAT